MASKDLKSNIKTVIALAPVDITSDTTTTGLTVDTAGYESCVFAVYTGVNTDGDITVSIYHDTDSAMGTEVEVTTEALGKDGSYPTIAAANDAAIYKFAYKGPNRYVRLKFVSATTTHCLIGATAILGHSRKGAVA